MTTLITMYDDITAVSLPPGAAAYAGYVDGRWANYGAIRAEYPDAHVLSIAVFPSDDATCLDVEPGDATRADIYGWFKRQQARGVWRPVIYSSVSGIDGIVATMTANGFHRDSYRLWSAHYGAGPHICSPSTCRLCGVQCDGTQWTSTALSRSLDESELLPGFFGTAPAPPSPQPQPSPQPSSGPYRHVAPQVSGESLAKIAEDRNTTVGHIRDVSAGYLTAEHLAVLDAYIALLGKAEAAGMPRPVMPTGMVYATDNR